MRLEMTQDHYGASLDGPSGLQLNQKCTNVTAAGLLIA